MAEKPPAFQFYAKDFLDGTTLMSNEEVGAYVRMLAWSWGNGPLPLDEARLARVIHATVDELRVVWEQIGSKWQRGTNGWINERLERQRQELKDFKDSKSESGKAGAIARWGKTKGERRNGKPGRRATDGTANGSAIDSPLTNGCRNDGSPVFDLRSSVSDLPSADSNSNPPIERAGLPARATTALAPAWRSERPTQQGLAANRHLRCDVSAIAACGYGGCVPPGLIAEWRDQCAARGEPADAVIRALVEAEIDTKPIIGDRYEHWRKVWGRRAQPAQRNGRESMTEQTMRAAREYLTGKAER